jgi:hypothetical protein
MIVGEGCGSVDDMIEVGISSVRPGKEQLVAIREIAKKSESQRAFLPVTARIK